MDFIIRGVLLAIGLYFAPIILTFILIAVVAVFTMVVNIFKFVYEIITEVITGKAQ